MHNGVTGFISFEKMASLLSFAAYKSYANNDKSLVFLSLDPPVFTYVHLFTGSMLQKVIPT